MHRSAFALVVLVVLVVLGACYTSTAPAPVPTAPPPAPSAPRTRTVSPDEALCCCTFAFAEAEDFPDVNKWESHAPTCTKGGGGRMPGQCIAWSWCGYAPGAEPRSLAQRPDLRPPPPIAKSDCCCAHTSANGEEFEVIAQSSCTAATQSACIDAGFCGRDEEP